MNSNNKKENGSKKLLDDALDFQQNGDINKAIQSLEQYLNNNPANAEVFHTLGGLYYQIQDLHNSIDYLEKAHQADSKNITYLNDLGAIQMMAGDFKSAIKNINKILENNQKNIQAHYNLGLAYHSAGKLNEAATSFQRAIELHPEFIEAYYNLATTLFEAGNIEQAIECCDKTLMLKPDMVKAYLKKGEIYLHINNYNLAHDAFEKAYKMDNTNPKVIARFAYSLNDIGRTKDGINILKKYLDINPDEILLLPKLGKLLQISGDIDEAEEIYKKALKYDKYAAETCLGLSKVRKFSNDDSRTIRFVEELLEKHVTTEPDKIKINYALGKIHDDCENYDKSFNHYHAANSLIHKNIVYDHNVHELYINDIIEYFTEELLNKFNGMGVDDQRPIFILGMPRSGTTLVEHIISSHSKVTGGGELNYFRSLSRQLKYMLGSDINYPKCCTLLDSKMINKIACLYLDLLERISGNTGYVTDKMPHNYLYIGLIYILLPGAKIIYCQRNPLDVCLSIYFQYFETTHNYAFDLKDIGHQYVQHMRIMNHWEKLLPGKIIKCKYEELIQNPVENCKKLIEKCNLDWEEDCLDFYKTSRNIKTASNWQVRQPIYNTSINRWRNYESYLKELKNFLSENNL